MQEQTDNILIESIQDGNHQAFATLVKKYTKYFYSICYRYTADKTNAEDLTQQAFLKLWEYPDKFDPDKGASFKTWFTQVIINMCIDFKRKHKHYFEDIEDIAVPSDDKETSTKIHENQLKIVLEKAIHKLPKNQQIAINLGFYQEIPYEEVAKIMKTTTSAVKSLIMRAKDNLRKNMKGIEL